MKMKVDFRTEKQRIRDRRYDEIIAVYEKLKNSDYPSCNALNRVISEKTGHSMSMVVNALKKMNNGSNN